MPRYKKNKYFNVTIDEQKTVHERLKYKDTKQPDDLFERKFHYPRRVENSNHNNFRKQFSTDERITAASDTRRINDLDRCRRCLAPYTDYDETLVELCPRCRKFPDEQYPEKPRLWDMVDEETYMELLDEGYDNQTRARNIS